MLNKTQKTSTHFLIVIVLSFGISGRTFAMDAMDYLGGCLIAMGAGLAGAAAANTTLKDEDKKFTTAGYGIAGAFSCLAGLGYVAIAGSQATFEAEYHFKVENEKLAYQYRRLAKERCILNETCTPGGRAIVVDNETEIKKQGDKVFETTTSTIEPSE